MTFKKILVPYDGSICAKRAFNLALKFAQIFDSEIILLECINIFTVNFVRTSFEEILLKKLRGEVLNEIKRLKQTAKAKNVRIKGRIKETPSISFTITNYSKNNNVDLIIMGSRGKTNLSALFLGSVCKGVVHDAKCPVVVVK